MPKLGPDGTGAAVGTQAIVSTPKSARAADYLSGERREFALAIADFALLYDGSGPNGGYAIGDYPVAPGEPAEYAAQGRPIAPPGRPEAISVDHHDPFLFNYKLEPMPVRLGSYESRWQQWSRDGRLIRRGDPAYAFNSFTHRRNGGQRSPGLDAIDSRRNHADGDPSTEIFEAYVGDKGVIRLIQGAQEVQHVFEINGLSWRRQPGDPASPRVASQETGISEHFEIDIDTPLTSGNYESFGAVDFRYGGGTVDAQWNGAWGLLRTYPYTRGALDPGGDSYWRDLLTLTNAPADAAPEPMQRVACRLAPLKGKRPRECGADGRYSLPANVQQRAPAGTQSALQGKLFPDFSRASGMTSFVLRKFCIRVEAAEIRYNEREALADPAAVRFVAVPEDGRRTGLPSGARIDRARVPQKGDLADVAEQMQCEPAPASSAEKRPLVLRMNAGDFAVVELVNPLGEGAMPRSSTGNSILPPIAPSSGPSGEDKGKISDHMLADRLIPSEMVSLAPQLVALDARTDVGMAIGLNDYPAAPDGEARHGGYASSEMPGGTAATQLWFAGSFSSDRSKSPPRGFRAFTPFRTARGMVAALSSLADPVKHPGMGLVGALVIEPEGARWQVDAADPTRALVTLADGTSHREAILVYQDGLNLKTPVTRHPAPGGAPTAEERGGTASVADCHVCDDTYDSGDAAVNYRTEPFWARLNQSWRGADANADSGAPALVDLNGVSIPASIWTTPVADGAAGRKVETPVITVPEGSALVIHAVHPGGRARQRAFVTYGHRYDDMNLAKFGSPNSALLAPRKATTAVIDRVAPGCWLWRDGPAQFVGGGVWGFIETRPAGSGEDAKGVCPIHD